VGDITDFARVIGVACAVLALALAANRVSGRVGVPAPVFFLIGAVAAGAAVPEGVRMPLTSVQRIVTVALVLILFHGGLDIGWRRFRAEAAAIVWLGVVGTAVTALAVALATHLVLGWDWRVSLLVGTALSPTDPAVVFSVLGRREITGRTGTLLEGESGANDPVGIALMAVLLEVGGGGGVSGAAVGRGVLEFALQMGVGAVVGLLGGFALRGVMRRESLPTEGMYPLRTLAGAGMLYAVATLGHGSGFLAVFVAGIVVGDAEVPYHREVARFHAAAASLAEVVAFTVLGLSVPVHRLHWPTALLGGLALGALTALVVRPLLVAPVLAPIRLRRGERAFVLWAGLKGAVPLVLGTLVLADGGEHAATAYGVIVVAVLFSVTVQGSLVPQAAARLGVPLRRTEPAPWSLGVRLRHAPRSVHRWTVSRGSTACGRSLAELAREPGVWVSLVVRAGRLVVIGPGTRLAVGDRVVLVVSPGKLSAARALFSAGSEGRGTSLDGG